MGVKSIVETKFKVSPYETPGQKPNFTDISPGWFRGRDEIGFSISPLENIRVPVLKETGDRAKEDIKLDKNQPKHEKEEKRKVGYRNDYPIVNIPNIQFVMQGDCGANSGGVKFKDEGKVEGEVEKPSEEEEKQIKENAMNIMGLGLNYGQEFTLTVNGEGIQRIWIVEAEGEGSAELRPVGVKEDVNYALAWDRNALPVRFPSAVKTETEFLFDEYRRRAVCSVGGGPYSFPSTAGSSSQTQYTLKVKKRTNTTKMAGFRVFVATSEAIYGSTPLLAMNPKGSTATYAAWSEDLLVPKMAGWDESSGALSISTETLKEIDSARVPCTCGCAPLTCSLSQTLQHASPNMMCLQWLSRGLDSRKMRLALHKSLGKSHTVRFSENGTFLAESKHPHEINVSWRPFLPVSDASVRDGVRRALGLPTESEENGGNYETSDAWRFRLLTMLNSGEIAPELKTVLVEKAAWLEISKRDPVGGKGDGPLPLPAEGARFAILFVQKNQDPSHLPVFVFGGQSDPGRQVALQKLLLHQLLSQAGDKKSVPSGETSSEVEPPRKSLDSKRRYLHDLVGLTATRRSPSSGFLGQDWKVVKVSEGECRAWSRTRFGFKLWAAEAARAIATEAERAVFLLALEMRTGCPLRPR
jgi:hypothetical protein